MNPSCSPAQPSPPFKVLQPAEGDLFFSPDITLSPTVEKPRAEEDGERGFSRLAIEVDFMEGLRVSDANLTVYIHPSKAKNVRQAIRRQLASSLLFQYNEAFDGVVLAYSMDITSKRAKILPGINPLIGVKLRAELLLFTPKPDMLLDGKVVKVVQESVHVIVLGFSSASIMFEDIRGEFKYRTKHGEGQFVSRPYKRHVIRVGTMLRFLVKSFDEEILHISGSLLPANTGCIRWLCKHATEEVSQTDRSHMKPRKRDREMEMPEQIQDVDRVTLSNTDKPHKSKKRKITE